MNINNEIKEIFKDHKAHFRDLGEVQILDWKIDNTFCCSIRYIFDSNKLYISGDYGCAVYWLTWNGTPQSFKGINLGYFYEKNAAHEYDEYEFNDKKAREDIEDYLSFMFEDYENAKEGHEEEIKDIEKEIAELDRGDYDSDEDFQDAKENLRQDIDYYKALIQEEYIAEEIEKKERIKQDLLNLVNESSSLSQWNYYVAESNVTDDLQEYDYDYWEWISEVGKAIPERAELHLAGLIMAAEQLEESEVKNDEV